MSTISKNYFGGRKRLDKINLMSFKSSADCGEKIIFQHTILDAANNYLFFGLAENNGTSATEFWFAYEYFYRIRSYDPDTWKDSRIMKTTAMNYNTKRRETNTVELTDIQMKAMCFDMHFNISNIRLSMDTFLRWLKLERTNIVETNWDQINTYLTSLQTQNHDTLSLDILTKQKILISPENP